MKKLVHKTNFKLTTQATLILETVLPALKGYFCYKTISKAE